MKCPLDGWSAIQTLAIKRIFGSDCERSGARRILHSGEQYLSEIFGIRDDSNGLLNRCGGQYALLCWLLSKRLGPVQDDMNRRGFGGAGTAQD